MRKEQTQPQTQRPPYLKEVADCILADIGPEAWHLLTFPAYQRTPSPQRVREIAKGIREGYAPGPLTLYAQGGKYLIVDGGHRFLAHQLNRERYGHVRDILALIYAEDALDQREAFVNENTKVAMSPTNIVRADNRTLAAALIRDLAAPGFPFAGCDDVADFPIRPLTCVKAALILHTEDGLSLDANNFIYLSVARALAALDQAILADNDGGKDFAFWLGAFCPFLRYLPALWGDEGRHLLNFGVLGFALFLTKNKPYFFDKEGKLSIKTSWSHVSKKRGAREFESTVDRSDFAKLAALKEKWENPGFLLYAEAARDPLACARELNAQFWKNRPQAQRVWKPVF